MDAELALEWLGGRGQTERRMLLELGAVTCAVALYAADNSRKGDPVRAIKDAIVVAAASGQCAQDRKYLRAFLTRTFGGVA